MARARRAQLLSRSRSETDQLETRVAPSPALHHAPQSNTPSSKRVVTFLQVPVGLTIDTAWFTCAFLDLITRAPETVESLRFRSACDAIFMPTIYKVYGAQKNSAALAGDKGICRGVLE